jgi:DNA modification methylase
MTRRPAKRRGTPTPVPDGLRVIPLADLVEDDRNPRQRDARAKAFLEGSLDELGAARSIVASGGQVVVGNGTREAALAAGITEAILVPSDGKRLVVVVRDDLSPAQRQRLKVLDNRSGELAKWNVDILRDMAQGHGDAVVDGAFTQGEWLRLISGRARPGKTDPDTIPSARETAIKVGDVFRLGNHVIGCGDCTKEGDVARVLGAERRADLVLTDPPYCSGGFQEAGRRAGSVGTQARDLLKTREVANDKLSTRGYQALMKHALANVNAGAAYVFTDWRMWTVLFDVVESCGFGVRNMIVWDKGTPGMGKGWRTQHELVMFSSRSALEFDDKKAIGNVVQAQRTGNVHHATEKPVDLLVRILTVTDMVASVYDPFLGSGTTLIACEQLGRAAFGLELEPLNVQTAIDRWEGFTGQKAVRA